MAGVTLCAHKPGPDPTSSGALYLAMDVGNIEIRTSALLSDRTCVRTDVICIDKTMLDWMDVPRAYSGYLSNSGNTWLTFMLSLAFHLSEPLLVSKAIDRELFINVHESMRIWSCWYPELKPILIAFLIWEQQTGLRGGLDRCPRFSTRTIDKRKVARIFARDESGRAFLREVRRLVLRTSTGYCQSHSSQLPAQPATGFGQRWTKQLLSLASPKWQRRLNWRIKRLLLRDCIL